MPAGQLPVFKFRSRHETVDWRRISAIDVDRVANELDFITLQEHITNVTFCNVENERCPHCQNAVDPVLLKLLRLAQLTIEYLLHSQEYLTSSVHALEEKVQGSISQTEQIKVRVSQQAEEVKSLKDECKRRKKIISTQQIMIHAGANTYHKCQLCDKAFMNYSFLQSHVHRRHPEETAFEKQKVLQSDKLQSEIDKLKEELLLTKCHLEAEQSAHVAKLSQGYEHQKVKEDEILKKFDKWKEEEREKFGDEMNKVKEMFIKEFQELTSKNDVLEKHLIEIQKNNMQVTSNLGTLKDSQPYEFEEDRKNQQENLKEFLDKQERKWASRMQQLYQEHEREKNQVTEQVKISYVSTRNMSDGKAETITNTLSETMDILGLKTANLVGLGSDGAAVMIGKQKGVAKLLKDKTSGLLVNCHCVNHRLALASAQAAAAIPYLTKLNDILRQLFYFFQNSSVRMAGLTEMQNILNIPQIKLKMASDTRWLSHASAVQSLRQCMMSVIAALEREATERNDITAEGLSRCIKTYNFVSSLMMLSDVLPLLSNLSKAWQRQDVNLTEIEPILLATKLSIMQLKDTPGRYFQSLHLCLAEEWSDLRIVYTQSDVMAFKIAIYDKYLETVVKHLDARFPDMPIISSFSKVFNAETHDSSESAEILFAHYSKNGSPPILKYESSRQVWTVASKMIRSQSYKDFSPKQILLKMAMTSELKESFPNLAKLAHIGLVIPLSTAECERGFSALKRIKSCLRNRMNQSTLNNLKLISLEGPDSEDFDYGKAADNWASRKKRRINI